MNSHHLWLGRNVFFSFFRLFPSSRIFPKVHLVPQYTHTNTSSHFVSPVSTGDSRGNTGIWWNHPESDGQQRRRQLSLSGLTWHELKKTGWKNRGSDRTSLGTFDRGGMLSWDCCAHPSVAVVSSTDCMTWLHDSLGVVSNRYRRFHWRQVLGERE